MQPNFKMLNCVTILTCMALLLSACTNSKNGDIQLPDDSVVETDTSSDVTEVTQTEDTGTKPEPGSGPGMQTESDQNLDSQTGADSPSNEADESPPMPAAGDVVPVTAQAYSGDTDAAAAPFLQWLKENAPETAAQMTEYSLEYDESGNLVFLPRGHFGGILPGTLEGLVQDRTDGTITARRFAWREQGGYRACVETVELKSKDGRIVHIPTGYDGIVADPEDWDNPPMLFTGKILSEQGGMYFGIFQDPLWRCSLPTYEPDKPWPTETYRFQVLGIDDTYGYFLWRPTDVQYDYYDPTEVALYRERYNMAEFITDDFTSANHLVVNPRWMLQLDGYQEGNLSALRALLSSVLTTGERAYFTIPPKYSFSDPGEDYGAWNIVLAGKRGGRTVKLDLPEQGWEDEQTYRVDRGQWDSVTLYVSLPGTPELFVRLF